MPVTDTMIVLRGGCHCGQLAVDFATAQDPAQINPRACDCSFCRKHGTAYISDPDGRLSISENNPGGLLEYQQGTQTASFLLCGRCGVLVAVVYRHDTRIFGAVNAGCLSGETRLGHTVPASPQQLSQEEKVSRWLKLWVPDATLTTAKA